MADRKARGTSAASSSAAPQQLGGVAGQIDPVQPDLLDERVLGSDELAPRWQRVLDELQVVTGPTANISLKARQSLIQIGCPEVVDDDQQVDVGLAVGITTRSGSSSSASTVSMRSSSESGCICPHLSTAT
jgi:hypothetical protein